MTGPYGIVKFSSFTPDIDDYAVFAASGERIDCDTLDCATEVAAALNERHLRNNASVTADKARGILGAVWMDKK